MYKTSVKDLPTLKREFPDWVAADYMRRVEEAHSNFPDIDDVGLTIISNFLSRDERQRIINKFKVYGGTLNKQPITMFKEIDLLNRIADEVKKATGLKDLENQMRDNTFYQKVINSPQDNDVQKVFHMDTFFPAWKFWYFPFQSSGLNSGNFRYIKNSCRLDEHKMQFMHDAYTQFLNGEEMDKDSMEGSFRINEKQIQHYYPDGSCEVLVPGNTLVIANVFGFHCRGNTERETERLAIHGSIRFSDPFKNRR